MPYSKKTEEWLKQWPEDVQKGYRANSYMEWLIHQYTQNLINGVKCGGVQVQTVKKEEPMDKPVVEEPVVDDDDDGEMFSLFD